MNSNRGNAGGKRNELDFTLESGVMDDYRALAMFHYRQGEPRAVRTVYRIVHHAPTVVGRYLGRRNETSVAAVLVRTIPHPGCIMRDYATQNRYRHLDLTSATIMLNREFRAISRVVVHPRFRGMGLAVRLVKHALANPETVYTESIAAMGRVHPFLQRAGMVRYDRPPRPEHARLIDALEHLGIEPWNLASTREMKRLIDDCEKSEQEWIESELRRWHRAACNKRSHKFIRPTREGLLIEARNRLLTEPVYYLARAQGEGDEIALDAA